jgi:organic radical activating enzyme
MKLIAIKPVNQPYINITWQVSDFCNFKCSYCNPGNWAGKNPKKNDPEHFDKIVENLDIMLKEYESRGYKGFKFFFSGGEPTVWPHLIPLIQWLKQRLDDPHIAINTNLSTSTNWWKTNYHLFHDIVASYHIDFVNTERYVDNLIFLQDKVNYLCTRMMMQENRFDEVIAFGKTIPSLLQNYNLEWVPLFDDISVDAGPWKYSEPRMYEFFETHSFESQTRMHKPSGSKWHTSSKEIYDDGSTQALNGNRLVAERRNFFAGWQCFVDESLFINSTGNITAASCGQGPSLGNIYDTVTTISKPIICRKEQCTCGTDILITKENVNG